RIVQADEVERRARDLERQVLVAQHRVAAAGQRGGDAVAVGEVVVVAERADDLVRLEAGELAADQRDLVAPPADVVAGHDDDVRAGAIGQRDRRADVRRRRDLPAVDVREMGDAQPVVARVEIRHHHLVLDEVRRLDQAARRHGWPRHGPQYAGQLGSAQRGRCFAPATGVAQGARWWFTAPRRRARAVAAPCYRARVRGTAIAAVIALVAGAQPARAEDGEAGERGVLVAPPAGLDEAVRAALAGWPIEVVIEPEGAPGSTMPGSAARARALAEGHGAAAVVWLGRDDGGLALWVYDRESGRAVTRPLPAAPPYDEPTAAAVALTVKTLLRHSTAAPAPARYGASEAAAATGGELASAPATAPDAAPIRQRALVRLDTLAGARLRRT